MKNIFKTLAAVAMIVLAASCSKDAAEAPAVVDETAKVSFSVELPGVVSRATNDGTTATELHYAVYQDNGDNTNTLLFSTDAEDQVKTMSGLSTTVELDLVSQQTYDIVFWAQAPGAYDPDFAAKSVAMNYDANKVGSNEKRDAFVYVWNNLTVNGSINETVTLRRPFAQLNVALTDGQIEAAQKAGFTLDQVKVSAKTHNAFGFFAAEQGAPVGEMIDIEFAAADYELTPNTIKVNNVDYDWVSFNYLLACTPSELVDVTIVFENENDAKTIEVPAFTNVPIERNHRTNIVGDLLTDPAKFEVVILPGFEDDDQYGVIDGQMYVKVSNAEELKAAFENADVDLIILTEDIVLTESLTRAAADPVLMVKKGKGLTIDLNGKKLSSTSTQTGKNYNMFDVRGTLTVKNGTMEYEHKGSNMGWNNYAELFYVGFNGTLNLDGVTAKNLGGSDMAYVIDMVNATNITVNVKNSTLESTYIPIRVFNNSKNGVNNVAVENSTLKGKYCFWVQYWIADGRDEATLEQNLNLDIFNGTNTFVYTGKAPVLYGFNESFYFDENGSALVFDAEALATLLTAEKANIAVALGADIEVPITSLGQQTGGSGEYKLGGENTEKIAIDLNGKKLTIATTYWSSLGAKNADALFTIKNGTMTSSQTSGTWNSYDITFANCNYAIEDVVFEKAIAFTNAGKQIDIKKVTINETHDYYAMWISAKGQTANIDNLTINSAGRGIKIDEQYVDAPAKVVMGIKNSTIKSAKKAAVIVKSVAGAEIHWGEGNNISEVAEDKVFAVWVDEDAAAYADKVVVNGAYVKVEGTNTALITTVEELNAAENDVLVLGAGNFGTIIAKSGKTYIGTEGTIVDAINLNGSANVTIKNIAFDAAKAKSAYDGGGVIRSTANIFSDGDNAKTNIGARNLVIDNCTFAGTFANGGASIAFPDRNRSTGPSGNITIKNCTFKTEGAYYHIYGYYSGYGAFNIENNTFETASQGKAIYLGRYQSNTPVVVKGNAFEAVASFEDAAYLQAHSSSYAVSFDASNNTFAN